MWLGGGARRKGAQAFSSLQEGRRREANTTPTKGSWGSSQSPLVFPLPQPPHCGTAFELQTILQDLQHHAPVGRFPGQT